MNQFNRTTALSDGEEQQERRPEGLAGPGNEEPMRRLKHLDLILWPVGSH